jgi:hypothetical protein
MPREVEIDGVKETIYSKDELDVASAEGVKQKEVITKLQTELGVEEGQPVETIFERAKELKESANPNWQEARKVMKGMKEALQAKGVEVDESGKVKSNPQGVSMEEIQKTIKDSVAQAVGEATGGVKKEALLAGYSAEDRKKIEPIFDKLIALGGSLEENLEIADAKVFPGRTGNATRRIYNTAVGGGAPASAGGQTEKFDESGEGKGLGKIMGLSFAQEKPKN